MGSGVDPSGASAAMETSRVGDSTLVVRLRGAWRLADVLPAASDLDREIATAPVAEVRLETAGVTAWDSGLVVFLFKVLEGCRERGVRVAHAGLPGTLERMLALVQDAALPPRASTPPGSLVDRVGRAALRGRERARAVAGFVGETTRALWRFVTGRARFRGQDLGLLFEGA